MRCFLVGQPGHVFGGWRVWRVLLQVRSRAQLRLEALPGGLSGGVPRLPGGAPDEGDPGGRGSGGGGGGGGKRPTRQNFRAPFSI